MENSHLHCHFYKRVKGVSVFDWDFFQVCSQIDIDLHKKGSCFCEQSSPKMSEAQPVEYPEKCGVAGGRMGTQRTLYYHHLRAFHFALRAATQRECLYESGFSELSEVGWSYRGQ